MWPRSDREESILKEGHTQQGSLDPRGKGARHDEWVYRMVKEAGCSQMKLAATFEGTLRHDLPIRKQRRPNAEATILILSDLYRPAHEPT